MTNKPVQPWLEVQRNLRAQTEARRLAGLEFGPCKRPYVPRPPTPDIDWLLAERAAARTAERQVKRKRKTGPAPQAQAEYSSIPT